jgi:WD40 repeat protein
VAFSPDGDQLATSGSDNIVRIWDAQSGKEVRLFRGHEHLRWLAYGADGKRLLSAGSNPLRAAPGEVNVWDTMRDQDVQTFSAHRHGVLSLAFHPGGKLLASAGLPEPFANIFGERRGEVKLWDVVAGREKRLIWEWGRSVKGVGNRVNALAFSPDGKLLATAGRDGLLLWDWATGRRIPRVMGHPPNGAVTCLAFSRGGKWLASGGPDGSVRLWDVRTAKQVREFPRAGERFGRVSVLGVALDRSGDRLAAGYDNGTVAIWDTATAEQILSLKKVHAPLAFHPGGKWLAAAGEGKDGFLVRLWDASMGKVHVRTAERFGSAQAANFGRPPAVAGHLAFSPDGTRLVTTAYDLAEVGHVKLWDVRTGVEMLRFRARLGQPAVCTVFSPDGRHLASGTRAGTIHIWTALPPAAGAH